MPGPVKRRPAPLSVRLNEAERRTLQLKAGNTPLSTYIKEAALGGGSAMPKHRRCPTADRTLISQVLGQLGASGLSMSLRKLADAAEGGLMVVDQRTASQLRQAAGHVQAMHDNLMAALYGRGRPAAPVELDDLFNSLNKDWGGDQ